MLTLKFFNLQQNIILSLLVVLLFSLLVMLLLSRMLRSVLL
jgi:hypothetical protein